MINMDHENLIRSIGYFIEYIRIITPPAVLAGIAWRIAR
jgi:hypothetical protein